MQLRWDSLKELTSQFQHDQARIFAIAIAIAVTSSESWPGTADAASSSNPGHAQDSSQLDSGSYPAKG